MTRLFLFVDFIYYERVSRNSIIVNKYILMLNIIIDIEVQPY